MAPCCMPPPSSRSVSTPSILCTGTYCIRPPCTHTAGCMYLYTDSSGNELNTLCIAVSCCSSCHWSLLPINSIYHIIPNRGAAHESRTLGCACIVLSICKGRHLWELQYLGIYNTGQVPTGGTCANGPGKHSSTHFKSTEANGVKFQGKVGCTSNWVVCLY